MAGYWACKGQICFVDSLAAGMNLQLWFGHHSPQQAGLGLEQPVSR